MPEERPDPLAPRPVIPIDEVVDPEISGQGDTGVIPIAEPGVVTPAPFAQVYNANAGSPPPPPPPPAPYYPPAYRQQQQQWPAAQAYVIPGRPGLVTAIGVMSIVVASLSIIASFISGCSAVAAREMSSRAFRMGMATTTTVTNTPGAVTVDISEDGFAARERAIFADVLNRKRQLTQARQQQLDTFLKEHGRAVLQPTGALRAPMVNGHVASFGQEYADANKTGPDYFVFTQGQQCRTPGRLRIYDDRAVYTPDDASAEALRSAFDPNAPQTVAPSFAPTLALDSDEARAIVNEVKRRSNNKLNANQAQSLQAALEDPQAGQWITPSSTTPGLISQVRSVVVQSDGLATIHWSNGTQLAFLADGSMTGAALKPSAGTATKTPAPGQITLNHTAANLGLIEAIGSALLAVGLLVAGILVLRQTPASRWMLLLYALIKVLLGVTAIIAFSWVLSSLSHTNSGGTTYFFTSVMAGQIQGMSTVAIVLASVGIIFPIALLIVLVSSKTVKDYYETGVAV